MLKAATFTAYPRNPNGNTPAVPAPPPPGIMAIAKSASRSRLVCAELTFLTTNIWATSSAVKCRTPEAYMLCTAMPGNGYSTGIIMPYCRATGPAADKIYRVTGAANGGAGLFMQRAGARFASAPDFPDGGVGYVPSPPRSHQYRRRGTPLGRGQTRRALRRQSQNVKRRPVGLFSHRASFCARIDIAQYFIAKA